MCTRLLLVLIPILSSQLLYAGTVTSLSDDGPGSLREIVAMAAPGELIDFDASLTGGTILFTEHILVQQDLRIEGDIILSGNETSQLFHVEECHLTLSGLTLRDGFIFSPLFGNLGGAIFSSRGDLTVENCLFENNVSNVGGAIFQSGTGQLYFSDCTFRDNYSTGDGGAIATSLLSSTLTVEDCQFIRNRGISGGAIDFGSGSLKVTRSWFENNGSDGGTGGAIECISGIGGGRRIANCTFVGNKAGDGAAVYLQSSAFPVQFVHNTVVFNEGASSVLFSGGVIEFANNIVCNNGAGADIRGISIFNSNGGNVYDQLPPTMNSGTNDVFGTSSNELTIKVGSPLIGDNGVPVLPIGCGPAYNIGNPTVKAGDFDGRGAARKSGLPDAGAFEIQPEDLMPENLTALVAGDAATLLWENDLPVRYQVQLFNSIEGASAFKTAEKNLTTPSLSDGNWSARVRVGCPDNQELIGPWSTTADFTIGPSAKINSASVFPNPSATSWSIRPAIKASHFELYNNSGQLVLSDKTQTDAIIQINATELNAGFYSLKIYGDNKTTTHQLIKVVN